MDEPTTSPAATPSAGPSRDPRRLFLESREVPCPHCRHNLRGTTGQDCPCCGEELVLHLAGDRSVWVPPLFMFLFFGWVLLAGLMNLTRDGLAAYQAVASTQTVRWQVTFPDGSVWLGGDLLRDVNAIGRPLKDPKNDIRRVVHRDWSVIPTTARCPAVGNQPGGGGPHRPHHPCLSRAEADSAPGLEVRANVGFSSLRALRECAPMDICAGVAVILRSEISRQSQPESRCYTPAPHRA